MSFWGARGNRIRVVSALPLRQITQYMLGCLFVVWYTGWTDVSNCWPVRATQIPSTGQLSILHCSIKVAVTTTSTGRFFSKGRDVAPKRCPFNCNCRTGWLFPIELHRFSPHGNNDPHESRLITNVEILLIGSSNESMIWWHSRSTQERSSWFDLRTQRQNYGLLTAAFEENMYILRSMPVGQLRSRNKSIDMKPSARPTSCFVGHPSPPAIHSSWQHVSWIPHTGTFRRYVFRSVVSFLWSANNQTYLCHGIVEGSYLAFPRKIVLFLSASIEWNQKVCTRVTVGQRKTSIWHLLVRSRRSCIES